jgi:Leucine-rich repeat (LRR) protein
VFGKCKIELIHADGSSVEMQEVIAFRKENPGTTIIYQTTELEAWWAALPGPWKEVFKRTEGIEGEPGAIELQRIADITEIDISQNNDVGGLSPLLKLYLLKSLKMNDTQIADLSPISSMLTIEKLNISNNPINNLESISGLTNLAELEFRNTQVSDLKALTSLTKLRVLDMAGTDIKKINELALLVNLEELSIYNTAVKSLSPLEGLSKLKQIKCYNTKLNQKKVNKFAESKPGLEIIFY